jgi:hypothetical protein
LRQFYLDDQDDAGRCHRSLDDSAEITIRGVTDEGEIKSFTGIARSVDEDQARPRGQRWRVTMEDTAG